jgi:hypothetical protein
MRVGRLIAIQLLLLSPLPALAQSNLDVARRTDLIGTWAMSCKTPTVPENSRIIYYVAPNNQLRRKIGRGAGCAILDGVVDEIEATNGTTVRLRVRNDSSSWGQENGRWLEMVLENSNGRSRILDATGDDGTPFVKDGLLIQNGEPPPMLEKCGEPDRTS